MIVCSEGFYSSCIAISASKQSLVDARIKVLNSINFSHIHAVIPREADEMPSYQDLQFRVLLLASIKLSFSLEFKLTLKLHMIWDSLLPAI